MIKEYIVKKSIGNHSGRVFSQKEVGELVHCKDCKWYRYHSKQCVKNGHHGTKLDDYCSYGERKVQENERLH